MRYSARKKILLVLMALAGLVILVAGIFLYQDKPDAAGQDIVVNPNIAPDYRRELEEELAEKKQKLAENPNEIDTLLDIGILEQRVGRLSLAERSFKQALKINNKDYLIYMYLGILYEEMDRLDDAESALRASTQLDPRDERPFQALITLYKMHYPGKADELDNIFRAASDYTKNPLIWGEYAQFLEDRRDYRQAWLYWQEVLAAKPENAKAAEAVARLEAQLRVSQ